MPLATSGRGLTAEVGGATLSGSFQEFIGVNTWLDVPGGSSIPRISPYVIMPTDRLVMGWQAPTSYRQYTFPNYDNEHYMDLAPGRGKLTIYGSLITDGHEHHDGLNQPLTSDAIHEAIGFTGPPLDQFDTEHRSQFSGSMASEAIGRQRVVDPASPVTSEYAWPSGSTRVLGDGASMQWTFGQPQYDACLGDTISPNQDIRLRPSSQFRNVRHGGDAIFYDCYIPSIANMLVARGNNVYRGDFNGNDTTPGYYQLLLNVMTTYGNQAVNDWWAIFPYEPIFSGLPRETVDPIPPFIDNGIEYIFQNLGWFVSSDTPTPGGERAPIDITWPQNLRVNGTQQPDYGSGTPGSARKQFEVTNEAKRSLLGMIFGIGDGVSGSVEALTIGDATGPFGAGQQASTNGPIRGFKYGIYNTLESTAGAYFSRTSFGQFRDQLEQRPDGRFLFTFGNRRFVSSPPVRARFVTHDGLSTKPNRTSSSNLSHFVTSSVPYFDGEVKNRGPIFPATQGTATVAV